MDTGRRVALDLSRRLNHTGQNRKYSFHIKHLSPLSRRLLNAIASGRYSDLSILRSAPSRSTGFSDILRPVAGNRQGIYSSGYCHGFSPCSLTSCGGGRIPKALQIYEEFMRKPYSKGKNCNFADMNIHTATAIQNTIRTEADVQQQKILMRFFKTGPGEYGEGDRFHGVRVPRIRELVKQYKSAATIDDVRYLLSSEYHEERLAGLLILVELYRRSKKKRRQGETRCLVDFYLSVIDRGNNWDLVDMVAPKILGDYVADNKEENYLLYELARMDDSLWHQRVAMVSTWMIIRSGRYDEALMLAEYFLTHKHDLMHKASGWMLREIGKRGGMEELSAFLDRFAPCMPRTMLRYAIEKLPETRRKHYMAMKTVGANG